MAFASLAGLRSGTIPKFELEIVNRALMPVHFLAYRLGSTGPSIFVNFVTLLKHIRAVEALRDGFDGRDVSISQISRKQT